VVAAAVRIRHDRARRYAALVLAVCGAAAYFATFRTGIAEVDAVEAFHFVEYGALGILFHAAWRRHADARRLVFPLLAGLTVGLLDELLQWHLASRVGELHDVMINLAAVSFGLVAALALDPPPRSVTTLGAPGARQAMFAAAATLALLALFVAAVHVGYEIHDPEIGVFRSRYSAAALRRTGAARSVAWSRGLPAEPGRWAPEDFYLTEARWHVLERNDAVAVGDTVTAWRENRILEKFFAPLVELPAVSAEYRWPADQRALIADAAAGAHGRDYVSRANPLPIYPLRAAN
jgi:hypothetical protein